MQNLIIALLSILAAVDEDSLEQRLWEASKQGDVEAITALIEAGADPSARTEFDATAVYFAASNDHAEACAALADAGAELDVADNFYDNTPLGMAGWLGYGDCVRVLIEKGAQGGIGALFAGATNGHAEVVVAVLETMDVPQGVLDSACSQAAGAGAAEVIDVLVAFGATEPATEPATSAPTAAAAPHGSPERAAVRKVADPYVPVSEPRPWARFRGSGGAGVADGQHPPLTWDLEAGEHVRWRTAVPGLGHSSPVVWGNKLFITTAVGEKEHTGIQEGERGWIGSANEDFVHAFQVQCYGLSDGALLWSTTCHEGIPRAQRHWKGSHANSTVAVDGDRVVAFFGSEGLFCLDLEGKLLWKKDLGVLDAGWFVDDSFGWGFASSPVIWKDRVIVQCDVKGGAFAAAFALTDGAELWRTERDELPSWGTPVVVEAADGSEVVMNATNAIRGYDPASGEQLWEIRGNSKITVSSPVAGDGLIVTSGGYQRPAPIYVIRAGSRGDLTPSDGPDAEGALLWSSQRDGVYQPTPLLYDGLLYMLRNNGVLTCYVAETGEQLYRERVSGGGSAYTASPVAADGYLYIMGESGDVYVVRAGPEFELVAVNDVGGATLTTPAISNGMIVLRKLDELVAIAHR